MKNRLKILAAAAAIFVSTPASAVCDGCVVSAVGAAGAAIVTTMAAQTVVLINEIAGAASASSSMIIAGVGGSVARSGEMVAEADAKLTARVHAAQAMSKGAVRDPCALVAGAAQTDQIGAVSAAVAGGMPGGASGGGGLPWASGNRPLAEVDGKPSPGKKVLEVALGKAPAPAPEVLAISASQFGCSAFAVPGSTRGQACFEAEGPLWTPRQTAQRPNADVRAETIFDGPQGSANSENAVRRRTISGDVDSIAVASLLRNLVDPLAFRDLKAAETRTDEGRRYLALHDTYTARIAVATQGLRDQISDITADRATVPFLVNMGETGAYYRRYILDYLGKIKDPVTGAAHPWKTAGISPSEYRNLEANRRYRNPDWYAFLGRATEREQFIEMATLTATQIALQTEMLDEMKRTRVALSMIAGPQVRTEMIPALARQHAAATR